MNIGQEVFALDIGTRTVVGLVVRKQEKGYKILAHKVMEHKGRAMYDGQIHDIEAVSDSVRQIKETLEGMLGRKLERAAVAAAGRALYTVESVAQKNTSPFMEITREDVDSLQADALANAIKSLSGKNASEAFTDYHCVGYSIIKWFLEDEELNNLIGQKGRSISVKIVATFLPRSVVESLLTVLKRCGLELLSITLEPIAAGAVVVLPGMRKLNIALVDIGAGTSDIAISRDGSIFAYGMVPMAGDEITEKICEVYLLDFNEGERVKRELLTKEKVCFQDILGQNHELATKDILEAIKTSVYQLSSEIARKILELNGKAPAAVICVGGGSLMPGLTECIAAQLDLSKDRVGIRRREGITFVEGEEELSGPFAVTPVGIAVNALEGTTLSFINVKVNDIKVNILGQDKPTVLKALLHAGITPAQIFGMPGMALTFRINGELRVVKGKMAKPAEIMINGRRAGLDAEISDGDAISFIPAVDGEPARAKVADIIKNEDKINIRINGRDISINPDIFIDGRPIAPEEEIMDNASITVREKNLILSDIFNIISFKPEGMAGKLVMKINGNEAGFTSPVKSGDDIEIYWKNIPS
ncbi:MAG TPA: cell division protein FtsA [Thermoanaerobacterales bacterium]|nr:cell division protein FtsA [Thermoanaerobacterales bacterium]